MRRAAEIAAPTHRFTWHWCLFRFNVERYADVLVEHAAGKATAKSVRWRLLVVHSFTECRQGGRQLTVT